MIRAVLFDWGNTVMRDSTSYSGPMAHWPHVEAMPGIAEALAALRPHYRLALATNAAASGRELVLAALRRVGLEEQFEHVFTARELGVHKPEPAFYRAALAALACAPEEAVMVGDGYTADVAGAKEAGLHAIWFNPEVAPCPTSQPLHDAEIRNLGELPAALTGLDLPDVTGCLALLAEQEVPDQVLRHSQMVAAIAFRLAERLREAGEAVDPLLAHRGGLLHDLDKISARLKKRVHGQLGAEILRGKGQPVLAEIVERHLMFTILDLAAHLRTWEEKLVFYADKVVEGASPVSVLERLAALRLRYPEAAEHMQRCLPAILELEAQICNRLGDTPEQLLAMMRTW